MTQPAALRADQLEAWVLSSYQRLERLEVPVFGAVGQAARRQPAAVEQASLRLLPLAGLPRELCDLDAWFEGARPPQADLDAVTGLSLFFKYLAAPLRYEPYSESAIHKAVPSSRGRFPLTYFLVQAGAGGSRAYAYVAEFHGLREVARFAGGHLQAGQSALVCVGRAWRYAEEYGEFAHVPCVLEAGHAQSQAQHLARLLEMAVDQDPDRELGRSLCVRPLEIALFCVGLRLACDVEQLPSTAARLAAPQPLPEMEQRFERLRLFQRCFDGGESARRPAGTYADMAGRLPAIGRRGVLALMRARTSGNDRGLVSPLLSAVSAGTCASVVATWRAIRASRPPSAAQPELGLSLVWLGPEPGRSPGIHHIEGPAMSACTWRGELGDALAQMLPYANTRYNLAALTAVLIIQADVVAAIERLGAAALREIHLAAGAAAQDFSLAATAHELFARPVKMMREARLESELSLRGQVVYLVLCGFARSANPTMELG